MRIRLLPAFLPALLFLAGCAGARKSSPPPGSMMVDHPMHTPTLVSMRMLDEQARAMQDSAIMQVVRARVDDWNRGDLDAFLAMYDEDAGYVQGTGFSRGREAVRRAHAERWFRDGGTPNARLSASLVRTQTLGAQMRLLVLAWTATDATTGRQEAWTSEVTFLQSPGRHWRATHEEPARLQSGSP